MSAGKGDSPRPVKGDVYRSNYEAIWRDDWESDRALDHPDATRVDPQELHGPQASHTSAELDA
jgi:hypothetical protein